MKNKIVYKSNVNLIFLLFVITLTLTSCAGIRGNSKKGYFGIGSPVALSPEKTKESLNKQMTDVSDKESLKNISPFKTNQGHFRSSNLAQKGKISLMPEGGDIAASTSNVDQSAAENATPIITINAPSEYSGLVMDGFTSLESYSAHKTDISEDFDIEIMNRGEKGDIYKIKFDLSVNPLRQNYWSYLWRWLDFSNGFLNFTKDYHAVIDFELSDPDAAEVVLVQPVNEGINSFEMALMQQTSQLASGATWQGVAAAIDLAERHREQFAQQRKNPILRGIVDSKSKFHFTISPRQYINQRIFRIPFFMSRYSIEQGLDSGLAFPVSAYIFVKSGHSDELELKVCGGYKKIGDPYKNEDKLGIPYAYPNNDKHCNDSLLIKLPKDKKPDNPVVTVSKDHPNLMRLSWGKRILSVDPSCSTSDEKHASVRLVYIATPSGTATLKHGNILNRSVYWIEPSSIRESIHNKGFVLEFCSVEDGKVIRKLTPSVNYLVSSETQSFVSIDKKVIENSTSGAQIKISIYGVPGKRLRVKEIKFGNRSIKRPKDINNVDHIAEFLVTIPDFKQYFKEQKTVSIIAKISNNSEILVAQKFTIN